MSDLEKQHAYDASGANSVDEGRNARSNGFPLAPTKSRSSQHGFHEKHTLANKPDGVDEAVWLDDASEANIKERKLSWQQATALLLTEYVVLAILAFPYSYQVLGYAGATLCTVLIGASTFYSTHILWRYCAAHPEIRDIADAAQVLVGGRKFGWWIAFIGLALNNWFIMGLHTVAGATAIQTIRSGSGPNTLIWAIIITLLMWLPSNVREFNHFTPLGLIASLTMFVCAILVMAGHGAQTHPSGWTPGLEITHSVWAPEGTTFVQGTNAVLNIVYTFIGHALIPSFIGDMENPKDFPKALGISITAQLVMYTIVGAVVYHYAGIELTTAPAYGSLNYKYGHAAAGLVLPTIIIVGILYSMVTSRAIFFQIFREGSIHRTTHTVKGWGTWFLIVLGGWIISFIIGESIPFFSDMLSLIACLFSSWFGYIMWAPAWYQLNRGRITRSTWTMIEAGLSLAIFVAGIFFFTVGTYVSVQSIINSYNNGAVKTPFTTANTGFVLDNY
ncbi:hypothetical protein JCM11251_007395 [Rhodosporidiobolus azoricus]